MRHNFEHQFDRNKLNELVLYVCSKCLPSDLGAVKLHKVLYFSDMLYFSESGVPITGAIYRKRQLGPTCDALLSAVSDLQNAGRLKVNYVNYFGYLKKEYHSTGTPDLSRFNHNEIRLIDEVIEFVCLNNTAKAISEFSHNKAWEIVEYGDIIEYNSVFLIFPNQVSQEALDWAYAETEEVDIERQKENTLGFATLEDFRKRLHSSRG